tara:strand:+ start:2274 stop:2858 length:585 start_codon:yes stop_codon:yes gene_type:complete
MSTKQRFGNLMGQLSVNYRKELTEADIANFKLVCDRFGIDSFEHAVHSHMFDADQGQYFPNIASITKHITGTTKQNEQQLEDKADMAWLTITGEIKRVGSYGSLKMEDKQALAAVKSLGGWKFICSKTEAELVWLHKEFIATYKNFENTPVEALPDKLPGRVALENHKAEQSQGLKHITDGIQNYRNKKGIESK